jgi:hypothetical protein
VHNFFNLNNLKVPNKSRKTSRILFCDKNKSSRTHKEHLNKLFYFKIFTTSTLTANVYKMFKCDKNQVSYCNVQKFKKWKFWEVWAIDKTWPTLDKFHYSYIHKWKKKTLGPYKNWNKFISFDMRKKEI